MKSKIFLSVFFILCISFALKSQTVFEDAVAVNFKVEGNFYASAFNSTGVLYTAKFAKYEGNSVLEIGTFDEKGTYTKKSFIDIDDGLSDMKVKFNNNITRVAVYTKASDDRLLRVADVATGEIINDIETGDLVNMTFTPDGNFVVFSTGTNSFMYDITEGVFSQSYKENSLLSHSKDGSILFCKGKNDAINYLSAKTGTLIKTFTLKDYKSIDFDSTGELIACAYPPYLRYFKLSQTGAVEVKNFENVFATPCFSTAFDYVVSDDNSGGKRNVYSLRDGLIYQSKIDSYQPGKDKMAFSADDKKFTVITDKNLYCYDFEMVKYFSRMAKRFADIYQTTDQFQTDQDLLNRASRVQTHKNEMLTIFRDEIKINEITVQNTQRGSLGVIDVKISNIGFYDPNTEMYDVTLIIPLTYTHLKNVTAKVKVPKNHAEIFSKSWQTFKATGLRIINNNLNGLYVFNIQIINDINNAVYRCIIHRTLPVYQASFEDKYEKAQKNYEMHDWYSAVLFMSDFPDDFLRNSVIDIMIKNALNSYFDEKWRTVSNMSLTNNSQQILIALSDFPPYWAQYSDVEAYRTRVVNSIFDDRLQKVKDMMGDKSYTEAFEYMNKYIYAGFKDIFSGNEYQYESLKNVTPVKDKLCFEIGKRSIEGQNYQRAVEMLSQITEDFPEYSDAQKLLNEANNSLKK